MSTKRVVEHLTGTARSAVRHPVATASFAVGLAKGATEATVSLVRRASRGDLPAQRSGEPGASAHAAEESRAEDTAARPPTGERTMVGGLNKEAAPPRMPGGPGEQYEHHPGAESRDIGHGDAQADQHEVDSWTEDLDVGRGEEAVDVQTPVGTPAADVGRNPDTAETDLQQPDTEPLMDPSTTKAVKSESETMRKASDPDKG